MNRIEWLSRYPAQIKPMIPEMIKMLSSDSRKFAWCVDAIYLGLEKGGKEMTDKLKNGIAQICKFLKIKDDVTKRLLDGAEKLATAQLAKEYVDAISSLHDLTDNWKTILEVRGASLKGAFTAQREALAALARDAESGDLTNAELFTSNLSEKAKRPSCPKFGRYCQCSTRTSLGMIRYYFAVYPNRRIRRQCA